MSPGIARCMHDRVNTGDGDRYSFARGQIDHRSIGTASARPNDGFVTSGFQLTNDRRTKPSCSTSHQHAHREYSTTWVRLARGAFEALSRQQHQSPHPVRDIDPQVGPR